MLERNQMRTMKKRLILASGSPRRRELLEKLGWEFEVTVSGGEERYTSLKPAEIVQELALSKAADVAAGLSDRRNTVVIGADTIVALDGRILGKPSDEEQAFRMLSALEGRSHEVYTGTAVLDFDGNGIRNDILHAEETKVFVHAMSEEEIRSYIATGEPMDKAGAYGIQGKFAAYIDRIEGDYYNVVGLPVSYLYHQLKNCFCEQ